MTFSPIDTVSLTSSSVASASLSRRIINLSPVMVIPEEQPAQPALPVQPEGMRVVCGHCGNTFLVGIFHLNNSTQSNQWSSCVFAYIYIDQMCEHMSVGLFCVVWCV